MHITVPPQVLVAQTSHDPNYGYYLTVHESDGYILVCLETNGIIREPLNVHVETTHTNSSGSRPAIGNTYVFTKTYVIAIYIFTSANYDYKATTHTLTFEPFNGVRSQQQCLEIKIINDSLPEDWEVFTILLSTNNSAVNLITQRVNVYITPNYNSGKYYDKGDVN